LSSYSSEFFNPAGQPKNVIEDFENFVWRVVSHLRQKESLMLDIAKKVICQAILSDIQTSFGRYIEVEEDVKV